MKLNKVLALALSGVMAVSMLAGCKGETGNGDQNTEVQPTVSNAVSVMNDAQSIVKFDSDTALDAALAAAAKKAQHSQVDAATYDVSKPVSDTDNVYKELAKKMDLQSGSPISFSGSAVAGKVTTATVLYRVNADGLTEAAALKQIAESITKTSCPSGVTDGGTWVYPATYTGAVSVVTVNTSDKGDTATAYYIAVSITQTFGRDHINN